MGDAVWLDDVNAIFADRVHDVNGSEEAEEK
jgi:hypothetical protein